MILLVLEMGGGKIFKQANTTATLPFKLYTRESQNYIAWDQTSSLSKLWRCPSHLRLMIQSSEMFREVGRDARFKLWSWHSNMAKLIDSSVTGLRHYKSFLCTYNKSSWLEPSLNLPLLKSQEQCFLPRERFITMPRLKLWALCLDIHNFLLIAIFPCGDNTWWVYGHVHLVFLAVVQK